MVKPLFALAALSLATVGQAQSVDTRYLRLPSRGDEALEYQPASGATASSIALVYVHPNGDSFAEPLGPEMSRRGHRVLMVNHHGSNDSDEDLAPAISSAITAARAIVGVTRVILVGHSGGGHVVAFYQNIAENGPGACRNAVVVYPCRGDALHGLAQPDGLILLDPTLGAFHQMSAVDPAAEGPSRSPDVDMFLPANGYDPATRSARYAPAFVARFHRAQSARNRRIIDGALARLRLIETGNGNFSDDEPLLIRGMGVQSNGARLYQPDVRMLSRTRRAHLLLKADGSTSQGVIRSVRPSLGAAPAAMRSLGQMTQDTTVRKFLAASAIRTGPEFAIGEDRITGVDWRSAMSSTPGNAAGIRVPTLILTMSCHYLLVPGEIIFDHLAAKDKTLAAVEGATHLFKPCQPQYGDTVRTTFDEIDRWLRRSGRF